MTIPKDATPAIDQNKDSQDTQVTAAATATTNNSTEPTDSGFTTSPVEKSESDDTQTDKVAELTSQVAELNRQASDKARREYEFRREEVAANPDKILEIRKMDPAQADTIVKSLWADKGYNTVDDVLNAVKTQEEEAKIQDPTVLQMKRENDILKQDVASIKESTAKKDQKEALSKIYEKYPNLHPDNDPDDVNWKLFKAEFDSFGTNVSVEDAADKAFKLAFGDVDEEGTRELQESLGNLPSGGVTPQAGKQMKISKQSVKIAEASGVDAGTVEKYANYFER